LEIKLVSCAPRRPKSCGPRLLLSHCFHDRRVTDGIASMDLFAGPTISFRLF
jgi:hypothetical protein